jgi:hypothetical protein
MACFSYLFGLLELLALFHSASIFATLGATLPEKSLLISRFQNPPVLHNHADPPRKLQRFQQMLHRRGKYLCFSHFPAEFDKILPFAVVIHDELILGEEVGLYNAAIV